MTVVPAAANQPALNTLLAAREAWGRAQAQLSLPLSDPGDLEGPRLPISPAPSQGTNERREP